MTMTVDEALQAAREHGGCDTDCVTPELAAEVERLRVELGASRESQRSDEERYKRAERVIDLLAKGLGMTSYKAASIAGFGLDHYSEMLKVREEAQTARLALDVAQKEIERLKAVQRPEDPSGARAQTHDHVAVCGRCQDVPCNVGRDSFESAKLTTGEFNEPMKLCIHVRPRDDGQGWAVDVFDGRRAWSKTRLGESPLNKAEAHRLAHKLRDPKFYTARTKRAVNSGGSL